MTHFVAYLRASPGNRQDLSVERQRTIITTWAAENGHTLGHIFSDDARTGSTIVGRDAFLDMVRYLDGRTPETGLVLWEYTRLSRSYDDAQFYLSTIRRNGYEIITLADTIPTGPIGKLIESVHLWAAEDERARMQSRVRSGLAYLVHVRHCWPNGGPPPTGYQFQEIVIGVRRDGTPHIGRQLIPDPETAPRLIKAFQMRAAGYSMGEIHNETRLALRKTSYSSILTNRLYIGEFTYGAQTTPDFCPPLIDHQLFDAVQQVYRGWLSRAKAAQPRRSSSSYLLSGLAICTRCSSPLTGKRAGRNKYYVCVNYDRPPLTAEKCHAPAIPAGQFEQKTIDRILYLLDNPQLLIDLQQTRQSQVAQADIARVARLKRSNDDLAANLRAQSRITAAIRDAGHSRALLAELKNLETAEGPLREQITDLEQAAPPPIVIPNLPALSAAIHKAIDASDRRALQLLLREIIVYVQAEKSPRRFGPISGIIRYSLGIEDNLPL